MISAVKSKFSSFRYLLRYLAEHGGFVGVFTDCLSLLLHFSTFVLLSEVMYFSPLFVVLLVAEFATYVTGRDIVDVLSENETLNLWESTVAIDSAFYNSKYVLNSSRFVICKRQDLSTVEKLVVPKVVNATLDRPQCL